MAPTKTWNLAGMHCSFIVFQGKAPVKDQGGTRGAAGAGAAGAAGGAGDGKGAVSAAALRLRPPPAGNLRDAYLEKFQHTFVHFGSTFATVALRAAYSDAPPNRAWLGDARRYIEANCCFAERFLAEHVPELVCLRPQATYLVWIDCSGLEALLSKAAAAAAAPPLSVRDFLVKRARVLLSSGAEFGPEAEWRQYQRLNVACSRGMLEDSLARVRDAVRSIR